MNAPDLRPYQAEVIAKFHEARAAGKRRIMLVAPTGSGKTVIAGTIIRCAVDNDQNVLIFAHRVEITKQTSAKLLAVGVDHGIIQAGYKTRICESVQVASIQTLNRRDILPPANLVVVDEAHHATANTYRKLLDSYPNAAILGLTATPCRRDSRGLGDIFEVMIQCPQVGELVELGFLVGTVVYAPADRPDLSGIATRHGDYVEGQLAARMNTSKLVGDVVTHWHRHAKGRKTVVFATDVAHSRHLCDEFRKSGALAEHLDGTTPKDERDAILAKLASGEIQIVNNCMVLTEGWDSPDVSCLILARPTKSMGLYRQMVGRGLRPAPGKTDCLLLDHAGAVFEHGFVDEPVQWTLDRSKKAVNIKHTERTESSRESRVLECSQCGAMRRAGERCRSCGFLPQRPPRSVDFIDGDLGHVDRNRRAANRQFTAAEKDQWHRQLAYIAKERGYKPGWAAYKFKEKFGNWPMSRYVTPEQPGPEVNSWVRSRQIAYAKAMEKRGAA